MQPGERLDELHRRQGAMYRGEAGVGEVASLLHEGVVWRVPGRSPIAGEHTGVDAVLDYFARRRDLAAASMRMTQRGRLESDDTVAAFVDGELNAPAGRAGWRTVGVYRFAGDLLAEAWLVPLEPRHFDLIWDSLAAGSPPPGAPSEPPEPLPGASVSRADELVTEALELGSVVVARHRVPAGFDSAPLYASLPQGMCPCRHVCLLESGALSYRLADGDRLEQAAGDVCEVPGGHLADVKDAARLVELTALEEYRLKSEAIRERPAQPFTG